MKNIYLIALAVLCASATAWAQKQVPSVVNSAFKTKYSNATNVSWDKEDEHEYEAEFTIEGIKYSVNFSDSGKWLETEHVISYEELPDLVQESFMASHKDAKIKAVAKIETSEGETRYEIEVKKLLGAEELLYNANGKALLDDDDIDNDTED